MDLNKCTCTCNKGLPFYVQPSCSLNCTEIKEPQQCSYFGKSGCPVYVNVPQECPSMCNWCPAAGASFGIDNKTNSEPYSTSAFITAAGATIGTTNETSSANKPTSAFITVLLLVFSLLSV